MAVPIDLVPLYDETWGLFADLVARRVCIEKHRDTIRLKTAHLFLKGAEYLLEEGFELKFSELLTSANKILKRIRLH